ncbi:MAG: fused MFS/spermidine synthase [Chloroflexi bacterium]|nr:fused MFS/spermidine synthase [Chloroflexota bacterium]
MSLADVRGPAAAAAAGVRARQAAFVAAIGLSAFLLFSLELLAGRLVLPVFGGAPAVWATSLSFFTAVLFLGYVYAHVVAARLPAAVGGMVQMTLAALTVVAAVVAPAQLGALRFADLPATLNVLLVLTLIAGAPALLLATTTPLLSAWYAERGHDPWWLFAVSNGASFLALLAYPFVIEPVVGLSAQRGFLAVGLAAYALSLVPIVLGARGSAVRGVPATDDGRALDGRRQALWLVAALIPAGLLSATTNFLQTDLISAPLIWIGPLAIYLASFVVAFAGRGRAVVRACTALVPGAATLLWLPFIKPEGWPPFPLLGIELGAFFVLAVAVHGALAADRPDARYLTRFYLILTAGGALGTGFVALGAPLIFSTVYEYPVLIVAALGALALLPGGAGVAADGRVLDRRAPGGVARRLLPYAAAGTLLYLLIDARQPADAADVRKLLLIGGIVVATAVTPRILALAAPLTLVVLLLMTGTSPLVRERTFFGVTEVRQRMDALAEYSGTTLHGLQFTDERRTEPTTYYSRVGPLAAVFDDLRARTNGARIGVVGLGAGTIAAYTQPGDELTFYEINPATVRIAQDPQYFTYLADAPVRSRIVVGDARLALEGEPSGQYDVLVLDAFSSDAVPAHLITREAMQTYVRMLRPGGVLVFHLSNRYYSLPGPVGATARSLGLTALSKGSNVTAADMERLGATDSRWLIAGPAAATAGFAARGWTAPAGGYVLTDDYADLTRSLRISGF